MAIFLTGDSRVMIQGITGSEGSKHGRRMLAAGTTVVGGTNPRKAGQTVDLGGAAVPVFGTVAETMAATGADVSVVFVPPAGTRAAVIEAVDAGIPLVIVITEGIPVHDTAAFWAYASAKGNATRIVGPNCPGVASPGKSNAGIIPADITTEGRIGLVSKSGTLTYQMMYELRDIGFSTAVGIGGDPVIGTTHIDCLAAFQDDPETDAIVMIGEIGGDAEERAAAYVEASVSKPVVAYVAGFTAPEGKTMGHAGAIISGSAGTAQAKKEALEKVGVRVGRTPSETARLVREVMRAPAPRGDAGPRSPGAGVRCACASPVAGPARGAPPRSLAWRWPGLGFMTASALPAERTDGRDGGGGPSARPSRPLVITGAIAACAAAGSGLVCITLLVLAGWIAAPHEGVGLPGVLRTAADLWLVGHHVGFALHGTGRIGDGRIGMLPLGLVLLPGALLWIAGRWVVRRGQVARLADVGYAALALAVPYGLVAGALALAGQSALATALAAAGGRVRFPDRPGRRGTGRRPGAGPLETADRAAAAARPGGVPRLGRHAHRADRGGCHPGRCVPRRPDGRFPVGGRGARARPGRRGPAARWPSLLISLTPSCGRSATRSGRDSRSAPAPWSRPPAPPSGPLPMLPMLAALPSGAHSTATGWVSLFMLSVPYLAGAFGGLLTARAAPIPAVELAPLWGFACGVVTGCALGLLAAFAGGPLGSGRLTAVGPSGWQAGVVCVLEVGVAAAVTTGLVNWVRMRRAGTGRG